jgi:uncharacterized protein
MLHGFIRLLRPLALALAVFAMMGGAAQAQSLDALRASGAVGESYDGLLVARDSSVQSYVDQVNAQRRQIYAQRAAAQGIPADQVGRVYAKEIMDDVAPGTWLRKPDGSWVQK